MNDLIKRPSHYCDGRKYEPKDVIRDWDLNFNLGSAVKYISRCGRKNDNPAVQDLEKAITFIQFEIDALKQIEEENKTTCDVAFERLADAIKVFEKHGEKNE